MSGDITSFPKDHNSYGTGDYCLLDYKHADKAYKGKSGEASSSTPSSSSARVKSMSAFVGNNKGSDMADEEEARRPVNLAPVLSRRQILRQRFDAAVAAGDSSLSYSTGSMRRANPYGGSDDNPSYTKSVYASPYAKQNPYLRPSDYSTLATVPSYLTPGDGFSSALEPLAGTLDKMRYMEETKRKRGRYMADVARSPVFPNQGSSSSSSDTFYFTAPAYKRTRSRYNSSEYD